MKALNIIFVYLLIISTRSFAYEASAYYVNENKFSIDGYDFIENDPSFPIVRGKLYDIVEEGEEQLAGGSFRKLMRITDPNTGESQLFKTRVINNTKQAVIINAKETERKVTHEYSFGDGDGSGGNWYDHLTIHYDITLEDGEKLEFYYNSNRLEDITLIAGDQIEFLRESRDPYGAYGDFSLIRFTIKVIRDTNEVGTFGSLIGSDPYSSVTGMGRLDYSHGKNENIYIVNELTSTFPLYISFYEIEGWWGFSNVFDRNAHYPYPGKQFEIIKKVDSETLLLRPYHSEAQVKLIRRQD